MKVMSVTEEEVIKWFESAQKWGHANSIEKCRETFESIEELSSFLRELEKALAELVWRKTHLCVSFKYVLYM